MKSKFKIGYKIEKKFFDLDNNYFQEFNNIMDDNSLDTHGSQNIKILNSEKISNYTYLNQIFFGIEKYIKENFSYINVEFENVWAQRSTNTTFIPNKSPFIPHIDKIRKFKAMLYMNDINSDAGPINLISKDPDKYEHKRLLGEDNIIRDLNLKDFKACSLPKGSIIFFDTNTPHFAGKVLKNEIERKVYRFNYKLKNNFMKKLFSF